MASLQNLGVRLQRNGDYWQAVWKDSRGKRRAKSLGRCTKQQALAQCRELAAQHVTQPGRRDVAAAPALAAWCKRYLEHRTDLAEGTATLHRETVGRLLEFYSPETRLNRITRTDAADWRAWLQKQKHRKDPLSEATVCRHVRTAKVVFEFALDEDLLPFNPFDRLKGTAPDPAKDWRQLSDDDVARLLDAAAGPWRTLLALCAHAGLRRGEAMRLKWADIQWERRRLVVRAAKETTKARTREVLIVGELERLLLDAREAATTDAVAPVSRNNLHVRCHEIIRRAGFEVWESPFHTLRKWRATSWRNTYPEHVVDAWLGHSQQVARKHYAAVPDEFYVAKPDALAEARAEIERLKKQLTQEPTP